MADEERRAVRRWRHEGRRQGRVSGVDYSTGLLSEQVRKAIDPELFSSILLPLSSHYPPLLQGSHYGRLRTEPICLWDGLKRGTSPVWKRKGERVGWDKGEGELEAVKYRVEISLQREVRSNRTLEHTAWGSRLLLLLQMVGRRLQRTDFSLCICIYVSRPREGICEHACSSPLSSSEIKVNVMFSG